MTDQQTNEVMKQSMLSTSNNGYVVAVDIGGTNLRLALADMNGAIAARWSSSTAGNRGPDAIIDLIRSGVEHILQETGVPREALRAIAAGAPGITNVDAGVVIVTSYLLGWRNVPLRDLLEAVFGIPAAIDNNVNLAAIGESHAGAAQGTSDFVFLAIGTGIGAGIVLNGTPFRGMGWSAGEIGYMLVPGVPDHPVDRGKPGALESMIGGEGIKAEWERVWSKGGIALTKDATATEIFDGALNGDPQALIILQQTARRLAYAIYNLSLVLNCPLFVLGGGVGMHPALCNATQHLLREWVTRAPLQLVRSTLGTEAQLIGAIHLALHKANGRSV